MQKRKLDSHLKVFQTLLKLRQHPTFKYGKLSISTYGEDILLYKREIENDPNADIFVILLNLGKAKRTVPLKSKLDNLPDTLEVVLTSIHSDTLHVGYVY